MPQNNIGFSEEPKNGDGIKRARTTGQIRAWQIPKTIAALQRFYEEVGKSDFPGLYILAAKNLRVYIGEAKSLYERLKKHINAPEDKIKDWEYAVLINDGRPASQSDFNDTVVRRALELYLQRLFKQNKYTVVAQGEPQTLDSRQDRTVSGLVAELNVLLLKLNLISKLLDERGQDQVFADELKKVLTKAGKHIEEWTAKEALIDGKKVFIRPGSRKAKGWQITFRDVFKKHLNDADGYLLVSRDGVLLIPLAEVKKVISDESAFKQNTIDVYVRFEGNQVTLSYKEQTANISAFRLLSA